MLTLKVVGVEGKREDLGGRRTTTKKKSTVTKHQQLTLARARER